MEIGLTADDCRQLDATRRGPDLDQQHADACTQVVVRFGERYGVTRVRIVVGKLHNDASLRGLCVTPTFLQKIFPTGCLLRLVSPYSDECCQA
jgi:hypothetical protein